VSGEPKAGPRRRGPRPSRLAGILLAVAAFAVAAMLILGGDDGGQEERSAEELERALVAGGVLRGPPDSRFALRHTDDWDPLTREELAEGDPPPLAGVRRRDGSGVVTVSERGAVRGGIDRLRRTLPGELEARFDDMRLVGIRFVEVAAGRALYTSWVREQTGRVQTNLVVPDGNRRSFSVDAVIRGDAAAASQEVGAMLRSFAIEPG
jgi:hypothetical protein